MASKKKDYDGVIRDYINDIPLKEIAEKYQLNDVNYIYYILRKNNIPKKKNKWTDKHTELLYKYYPTASWDILLEKLSPFPKDTISHYACNLKIERLVFNEYTEYEIYMLCKYYELIPTKELIKYLPGRTESSVVTKANRIGLVSREKWSDEDSIKLKSLYALKTNEELSKIFNRTSGSIMAQGQNLGLNKDAEEHLYIRYDNQKLIDDLKEFAQVLGRTPLSHEINENKDMAHYHTYRRCFDGYINACQLAGLEPNYDGNMYSSKTYRSKNNDLCLSQPELIITNLFIDNKLPYEKEVYYSTFTNDIRCGYKRCDWFLSNDIIVEYFGMERREFYKKRMQEKQIICSDNGLLLLELYPKDMTKGLKGLLNKFREHGIELKINI